MEIVELPIDDVVEYENNPRDNEDAVAKVAQSIMEFGFVNPISIDKNNVIIAGHTRLKAARQLGYEKVPCIIHDIDEASARIARIAENRTHDFATWDIGKLQEGLKSISLPTKAAFFMPANRDRIYYAENRVLSFGKIEIEISEADANLFTSHFSEFVERRGTHLGFINYLVGGLTDV